MTLFEYADAQDWLRAQLAYRKAPHGCRGARLRRLRQVVRDMLGRGA